MKTENLTWEEVKVLPINIIFFSANSYSGMGYYFKESMDTLSAKFISLIKKNLHSTGEIEASQSEIIRMSIQRDLMIHPDSIPDLDKWYKEQECKHTMQQINNDLEICTKCCEYFIMDKPSCGGLDDTLRESFGSSSILRKYYSGKDALDKLMRRECDYIVCDEEYWRDSFTRISLQSSWRDCKLELSGRRKYLNYDIHSALTPKYYLQTKWLCLNLQTPTLNQS